MILKNIAKLVEDLTGADERLRKAAAKSLFRTSETHFTERKIDPAERRRILRKIEPLATDESAVVRKSVARLVGLVQLWTDSSMKILRTLLSDADAEVREFAVGATMRLGPSAARLQGKLLRLATDEEREVRIRVPYALGQLRQWNPKVREALLRFTEDDEDVARLWAFEAIGLCAPSADTQIVDAVAHNLSEGKNNSPIGASQLVATLHGNWDRLRGALKGLVSSQCALYAVYALCKRWPDSVEDPVIRKWLEDNRRHWWAERMLATGTVEETPEMADSKSPRRPGKKPKKSSATVHGIPLARAVIVAMMALEFADDDDVDADTAAKFMEAIAYELQKGGSDERAALERAVEDLKNDASYADAVGFLDNFMSNLGLDE